VSFIFVCHFLYALYVCLYIDIILFFQVVDASSSLCIVKHLIMELNLLIGLSQHHCEKENVHVVATTSLNVLEVDNDLNMAF